MNESNGERENVKARRFTRYCVSDALIFDLENSKNVVFLCKNAIKQYFGHIPYVGNLSKGLLSVGESNREREKVRERRFTWHCLSDELIFNLQNSENVDFLCIHVIKHVF